MVEDTHGECELGEFAVVHDDIGLETSILRRAHTREVHAIFRFPIVLLQIAQMISHHRNICPPLFQTNQYPHTDFVHTCLSHTVEAIDTPFKFGLHASRMVRLVICFVVSLLKADYSVQAMIGQLLVFFCFKRHYLNLEIAEIRFG